MCKWSENGSFCVYIATAIYYIIQDTKIFKTLAVYTLSALCEKDKIITITEDSNED